ncbi:MAG: hypothetical protein JNK76_13785 [Planctomycetales bacterium]|nr:hypothetical protein [Planctomycetales bacterium]MBN8624999.1 hypothetical protein [Planctomycetota bacterium]
MSDAPTNDWQSLSRSAKHIGNFGEGLVIYSLIRAGYEVATVDHVGADLIAERAGKRFAISVKSRLYRAGSVESRGVLIAPGDIEKLESFAARFQLKPLFAHVCSIVDDKVIHLVMFPIEIVSEVMSNVQSGFRKDIRHLIDDPRIHYCFWSEGALAEHDFIVSSDPPAQSKG